MVEERGVLDSSDNSVSLDEPSAPSHLAFVLISSTESHIKRLRIISIFLNTQEEVCVPGQRMQLVMILVQGC